MMFGSYAWYAINFDADENKFSDIEQAKASRDLISNFIDELLANYAINQENVTLVGFSQGCILSYAVALCISQKNATCSEIAVILTKKLRYNTNKTIFSNLKIFASHGTVDHAVG